LHQQFVTETRTVQPALQTQDRVDVPVRLKPLDHLDSSGGWRKRRLADRKPGVDETFGSGFAATGLAILVNVAHQMK